ncbi:MAG: hypothetical protein ACTINZ_02195 [Microbacterium gubbeenense]|uniref:hypothetical protein n=1 Tax=Microbacterium gubbeenense TaxID=159896 RepID=UPI003F99425D
MAPPKFEQTKADASEGDFAVKIRIRDARGIWRESPSEALAFTLSLDPPMSLGWAQLA